MARRLFLPSDREEYTDGVVAFRVPESFSCEEEVDSIWGRIVGVL